MDKIMTTSGPDPLSGIRSKIERSKKHVSDLVVAARDFMSSNPYKVATDYQPDTRKLFYYVSHVEPVPSDITQIAGDAFGSMVSILDHLAYRLFLKHSPGKEGHHVYFPILSKATDPVKRKDAIKRKTEGIEPILVIPALEAVEAYKGGRGHQLWVLNELNNLAKHRDLIAVGSRFISMDIGPLMADMMEKLYGDLREKHCGIRSFPSLPVPVTPLDPMCPLKVGDVLFIDQADAEPNENLSFQFDVGINEPAIIQAAPLIETVHQLAGLVDSIVADFSIYL